MGASIGICTLSWSNVGCCMEQTVDSTTQDPVTTEDECTKCDNEGDKCQIVDTTGSSVITGICVWPNSDSQYGCCEDRTTPAPTKEVITCGNDNDCDGLTDGDYICKYEKRC